MDDSLKQDFIKRLKQVGAIIPFCTHEGSNFGSSVDDLKKKCPKSKFLDGLAVRGSDVKKAQKEVNAWIDKTMKTVK